MPLYENEIRFNGVCSRNRLFDVAVPARAARKECSICNKSWWVQINKNSSNGSNVAYFDRFGVEHISREV